MPFPDEDRPVEVVPYRSSWPGAFEDVAGRLRPLRLTPKGVIEHVGATAVPGLAAKDVIDVQVRVPTLLEDEFTDRFAAIGFRRRPEVWNRLEATRAGDIPKLVFAPPAGSRPCNVHVRVHDTAGALDTLLLRDCLRSDASLRSAWGDFKVALVRGFGTVDLATYGQIKQHAWLVLMHAADAWAASTAWSLPPLAPWPDPSPS